MTTLTHTDPRLYKVDIHIDEDNKFGVRVVDSENNFIESICTSVSLAEANLIGNAFGQLYRMDVTQELTEKEKVVLIEKSLKEFCEDRHENVSLEEAWFDDLVRIQVYFWNYELLQQYKPKLTELVTDLSKKYQVEISLGYTLSELYQKGMYNDPIIYIAKGKVYSKYNVALEATRWLETTNSFPTLKDYARKHNAEFSEVMSAYVILIGEGVHPETVFDQMDEDDARNLQVRIEEKLMEVK